MMILTMDLAARVDSYSINYFNCRYDVSQACEEERMNDPAKRTYYLLKKQEIKKMKGHSCQIKKRTQFSNRAGSNYPGFR